MKKPVPSSWPASQPFGPQENAPWVRKQFPSDWRNRFSFRPTWGPPAIPQISLAVNKWLVTAAVMLATIMEMLDVTIANVALDHIRGSLSAGVDEASWVLTSYIVSNAIVLPLTGWLGNFFGRKRFFSFCVILFTVTSFLCGAAPNLPTLIFFRVLQGAAGGALMPMSQTILLETFPPKEHAMAMAVWGVGMMLGPIMGPTLGGWITDNYSWRWIFYINVPMGVVALLLISLALSDPPVRQREVKQIDWWGLGLLILGVGALQIMLDTGERADWFSSHFIVTLAVLAVIGMTLFVIRELYTREPVVDLRILKNRTFAVGTIFMTLAMFGMYGTFVLVPLYCQLLAGYTPLLAGQVMSLQGVSTFFAIMVAGRLFNVVDPRVTVSFGCLVAGIGAWDMTQFNPFLGFWEIAWPGILRGIGSGLIFVPMTTLSLGAAPKGEVGNASALFNMVRSLGGGIGIALLVSFLSRGAQIHQHYLTAHVHPYNPILWQRFALADFMPGLDSAGGQGEAFLTLLYGEVQRQALLLSFVDDFRLIAYLFFALIPLAFLMHKPQTVEGVAAH